MVKNINPLILKMKMDKGIFVNPAAVLNICCMTALTAGRRWRRVISLTTNLKKKCILPRDPAYNMETANMRM